MLAASLRRAACRAAVRIPTRLPQVQHQARWVATPASEARTVVEQRAALAKQELATLAAAFHRYDGEGKGALNPEQLKAALQDLDLPAGEVDVRTLFERLDVNNDGTIELSEWLDHLPHGTKVRVLAKAGDSGKLISWSMPEVKINYTYTDEAPMLATYSLLPVLRAFCKHGKVSISKKDISVAARIKAMFPDYLRPEQRVEDELTALGDLAKTPSANIVKLPNVSASIPQLTAAVAELQAKGFAVPNYPADPATEEEKEIKARYSKVLGSAVNPVLREGNSDRRVAAPVKAYARKNPHKVGKWTSESKSHVASMTDGDFFATEQSYTMPTEGEGDSARIELVKADGSVQVLKGVTQLLPGEVIDASVMRVDKLAKFYEEQIEATEPGTLFSLHLKATMMKVSDPILFGHCVKAFFKPVFAKHAALFDELSVNANNGLGDVVAKIAGHAKEEEVKADIQACLDARPDIAMVDSRKGITNLHVPSDVIVDASMAAAVRDAGQMWDKDDKLVDAKFVIPDRCYAGIYQAIIEDCKEHGELKVNSCGATSNVGLMAAKAEEYGSHDKTFQIPADGKVRVVLRHSGDVVLEHDVSTGDVWRMCQTKDGPIQDWVKLAVNRARATGSAAIFWLTEERAHDRNMIAKVNKYLADHDTAGLDIRILSPIDAMKATLERARRGEDTISVTGNVLRDYLTDLFPILELGTSAKMLSIVPLLAGGGMFETGAGGSAPKHVQQFAAEGHLRWDSLGEFLAMAVSLEDLASKTENFEAKVLADTLNTAVGKHLDQRKAPSRKVMELDNRGSHFYLALFWAEALAAQNDSLLLKERFTSVAQQLRDSEAKILGELIAAEGKPANAGGYWLPDPFLASQAMRPSPTFNSIIDATRAASEY